MSEWQVAVPAWAARQGDIDGDALGRWLDLFSQVSAAGIDIDLVIDLVKAVAPDDMLGGAAEQCRIFMQFVKMGAPSNLMVCYNPQVKRPRERWFCKAIPNIEIDTKTLNVGMQIHTTWQGTDIPQARTGAAACRTSAR